jgi:hypothetical protein
MTLNEGDQQIVLNTGHLIAEVTDPGLVFPHAFILGRGFSAISFLDIFVDFWPGGTAYGGASI